MPSCIRSPQYKSGGEESTGGLVVIRSLFQFVLEDIFKEWWLYETEKNIPLAQSPFGRVILQ